jgi:CheY-like chemotaxis protein
MVGTRVGRAYRVLVVDDCRDTARTMSMLLGLWGHVTREAYDGAGALAEVAAFRPDAVLLDLGLPGIDGWRVAEAIRKMPGGGSILLVAVSGFGQDSDREQSLRAGCDLHMTKPVATEALRAVLDSARPGRDCSPEELAAALESMGSAAEVIDAIDRRGHFWPRDWDLRPWSYELVPWGVRFRRHAPDATVDAEVTAVCAPPRGEMSVCLAVSGAAAGRREPMLLGRG